MPIGFSHSNSPSPQPLPNIPVDGEKQFSRRRFFSQLATCAAVPLVAGVYANRIEPFWPKYFEIPIRIRDLPPSFENFRIAQVTDMHTGNAPTAYLQRVMQHVNHLKPDMVAVTGDMLHHNPTFVDEVAQLLKNFSMPTVVSFGNHDFAPNRGELEPFDPDLPGKLQSAIRSVGITVLRNQSMPLDRAGEQIWLVGLDDLWFGNFDPAAAFRDVNPAQPAIVLSHNPDTAEMLSPHRADLILSGHTHGGQIRLPYYGALRLNLAHAEYDMGHFQVGESQLFVSTGVGYIRKIRFNCRPQVPVFRLRRI